MYPPAEDHNAEYKAAAQAGVCPECHFANGLHNEGACSRWRPAEDDDDAGPPPPRPLFHQVMALLRDDGKRGFIGHVQNGFDVVPDPRIPECVYVSYQLGSGIPVAPKVRERVQRGYQRVLEAAGLQVRWEYEGTRHSRLVVRRV